MQKGINKVIIVGNLGNDPDMKSTADGRSIANLSVATSESWKDKNSGENQEKTEWHRIVIFGKLAEIAGQYLKKGSQVYFEGKLQTRKWQDKSGQERYSTEIIVDSFTGVMQMLSGRIDSGAGTGSSTRGQQPFNSTPGSIPTTSTPVQAQATSQTPTTNQNDNFEDVPF